MGLNNFTVADLAQSLRTFPLFKSVTPHAVLGTIDFFSDIPADGLEDLSREAKIGEFPAGTIVCRHGKYDESFHLILDGTASAVIPTETDPRFELYRLGAGDFFGEEQIFSQEPRENSIIALSDLVTLMLSRTALKSLISASEKIHSIMDRRYIERSLRGDLRSIPLFAGLKDELFEDLLDRSQLISMESGSVVFREGDVGDAVYLIREGRTDVYRTVEGERKLVAILAGGQYFGEMSLISDEARNATVECAMDTDLVRISRADFLRIVEREPEMMKELREVYTERRKNREDILKNPNLAVINRTLLDLNRGIYRHLDILAQCVIDTERGGALLATMPGSRYPYVYPRDSACASRFLFTTSLSPLRASNTAFRLLGEIARFILHCQREDGYWGQRYGTSGEDKAIYRQEDNVAHGVSILCRYLLASKARGVDIPQIERYIDAIRKGFEFSMRWYYRNEIHLYYSTTSIHESAIEEGYSIWVNYAYRLMLELMARVKDEFGVTSFGAAMELASGFSATIERIFTMQGRFVRRLKPNGEIDLRPDITLMSPFFFGTGLGQDSFSDTVEFRNSIEFIRRTLWDPDLGMLQRYLPFIEDPHTHVHAGNGPWLQYTAMLAQYYYYTGNIEEGDSILGVIDSYKSREGYLCEHLTTPERFFEFKRLEWVSGHDFEKEFAPDILVDGVSYDLIVEELSHMKDSYDAIERRCLEAGNDGRIFFAIPLMWSHAEYAMALMLRAGRELEKLKSVIHETAADEDTASKGKAQGDTTHRR